MQEASGSSFGYTGKQQTAIPKVVTPAPMAARANPVANKTPAPPKPAVVEEEMDDEHEMQVAAKASANAASAFPQLKNFHPLRKSRLQPSKTASSILPSMRPARKRACLSAWQMSVWAAGTTRRLWRGNRSWRFVRSQKCKSPRQARQAPPEPQPYIDPNLDDDQLTIPAFLRRQAN